MSEKEHRPGTFKKGDPRINRNGRPPKGTSVTELVRKQADLEIEDGKTYAEKVAEILVKKAADGDLAFIREYMNRVDGTPKQTQVITGANGDDLFQAFADLADSTIRKKAKLDEPEL